MFFKATLLIHIICVATWFGGITLMAMLLRDAIRSQDHENMISTFAKVQRWNLTMYVPTAALVLLTGIIMLFHYDTKPAWLLVKERFGSLLVVLFILFITVYSKRVLTKLETLASTEKTTPVIKKYIMWFNLFLLAMGILIFFVTFKVGS